MPYAFNVYLIVPELVPSYEGGKSMGMSSESKQVHWGGKAVDHAINVSMNLWLVWWDVDITRPKKINSSRILGPEIENFKTTLKNSFSKGYGISLLRQNSMNCLKLSYVPITSSEPSY
jgi:hypothetical protein